LRHDRVINPEVRELVLNMRVSRDKFLSTERDVSSMSNPPEGRYANYFKVGHNAFEFIIDCGQYYTDNGEPQVHTRIITSPAYGKALLQTLIECLDEYEKSHGPISG